MRQTRKYKAALLLARARKGPDGFHSELLGMGTPEYQKLSEAAKKSYRIWSDTWLVPLILELVPELKNPERFESEPGAWRNSKESKS